MTTTITICLISLFLANKIEKPERPPQDDSAIIFKPEKNSEYREEVKAEFNTSDGKNRIYPKDNLLD